MNEALTCHPIGYFHSSNSEKYMTPRQAEVAEEGTNGLIVLNPEYNFEQALEDLAGFERIWIIYWFHQNTSWKPKVTTPRNGPKRGVFATRSPHRPNPIGLSCVELLEIKGRKILIGKNDLLHGTPILDIKPYLSYADAFSDSKQGWVEGAPQKNYTIRWSPLAEEQALFLVEHLDVPFIETVCMRLEDNPFPFKNHRIKQINEKVFELAFKTWRLHYSVTDHRVDIQVIKSGYDQETLEGRKTSRWNDVLLHQKFLTLWPSSIPA
jgi:tRNA-Thr(GGU) m(6)t(6)A37 methyltransferase TsaA